MGPLDLLEGVTPFMTTHKGSGNYEIQIFSTNGKNMTSIVNEVGNYQGTHPITVKKDTDGPLSRPVSGEISEARPHSNTVRQTDLMVLKNVGLSPGLHVVVITAHGEWKIDIAEPVIPLQYR